MSRGDPPAPPGWHDPRLTDGALLRLLRGTGAATIATAVALGGHLLGGGDAPTALGVLLPWWISLALCTLLARIGSGTLCTTIGVLLSQGLFHVLFRAGIAGCAAAHLVDPPGKHLGHGSHAAIATADASTALASTGLAAEHLGTTGMATSGMHAMAFTDPSMLLGHALAALATIVLLRRGEALLVRALGLALAALNRLVVRIPDAIPALVSAPRALRPASRSIPLPIALDAVISPLLRRGPPALIAA